MQHQEGFDHLVQRLCAALPTKRGLGKRLRTEFEELAPLPTRAQLACTVGAQCVRAVLGEGTADDTAPVSSDQLLLVCMHVWIAMHAPKSNATAAAAAAAAAADADPTAAAPATPAADDDATGAFLTALKPHVGDGRREPGTPPGVAAEWAALQRYLQATSQHSNLEEDLRALLFLGLHLRTRLEVAKQSWDDIERETGLKETHKRVRQALTLFGTLLMDARMYRLRHLTSPAQGTIAQLYQRADAIRAYLAAHPDEQRWWSNDDDNPPIVMLPWPHGDDDAKTIPWLDADWL